MHVWMFGCSAVLLTYCVFPLCRRPDRVCVRVGRVSVSAQDVKRTRRNDENGLNLKSKEKINDHFTVRDCIWLDNWFTKVPESL